MDIPKLTIKGKDYEPKPPTMKAWRLTAEFDEQDKLQWDVKKLIDAYEGYIVAAFDRPEVTRKALEETMKAADLIPFGNKLKEWVLVQVFDQLVKVPNAETPEAVENS